MEPPNSVATTMTVPILTGIRCSAFDTARHQQQREFMKLAASLAASPGCFMLALSSPGLTSVGLLWASLFCCMARPCSRCGSTSIRQDRSLGGRSVCGACGLPAGTNWSPRRPGRGRGATKRHRRWLLLGLLPLVGVSAGIVLMRRPQVPQPWLTPPSAAPTPESVQPRP